MQAGYFKPFPNRLKTNWLDYNFQVLVKIPFKADEDIVSYLPDLPQIRYLSRSPLISNNAPSSTDKCVLAMSRDPEGAHENIINPENLISKHNQGSRRIKRGISNVRILYELYLITERKRNVFNERYLRVIFMLSRIDEEDKNLTLIILKTLVRGILMVIMFMNTIQI